MPLFVSETIQIADWELVETFIRASGPGGQNVNKVASAVQLRFDARNSPSLPDVVKARLKAAAGRRMTRDGVIVIEASRFREQQRNREDARERLAALIETAATPPKKRIKTRVSTGQKKRRVEDKRRRGETKSRRGAPPITE